MVSTRAASGTCGCATVMATLVTCVCLVFSRSRSSRSTRLSQAATLAFSVYVLCRLSVVHFDGKSPASYFAGIRSSHAHVYMYTYRKTFNIWWGCTSGGVYVPCIYLHVFLISIFQAFSAVLPSPFKYEMTSVMHCIRHLLVIGWILLHPDMTFTVHSGLHFK